MGLTCSHEHVVPSFSLIFIKPACLPLCCPLLLQPNASSPSQQNHLLFSLPAAKGFIEVRPSPQRIPLMKKKVMEAIQTEKNVWQVTMYQTAIPISPDP